MDNPKLLSFLMTIDPFVFKVIMGLCAAFLGITFLQSAIDKIRNYAGTKTYFHSQFGKSPLKNGVNLLLPVLTLLELLSGLGCLIGIILLIARVGKVYTAYGLLVTAITLLCLLFGQRIAKDYAGAASLTGYFLVALVGLLAFGLTT